MEKTATNMGFKVWGLGNEGTEKKMEATGTIGII